MFHRYAVVRQNDPSDCSAEVRRRSRKSLEQVAGLVGHLVEDLSGVATVKAPGAEQAGAEASPVPAVPAAGTRHEIPTAEQAGRQLPCRSQSAEAQSLAAAPFSSSVHITTWQEALLLGHFADLRSIPRHAESSGSGRGRA